VGRQRRGQAIRAPAHPAIESRTARVRFLSVEPLLEDIGNLDLRGINWVIVGGESGAGRALLAKAGSNRSVTSAKSTACRSSSSSGGASREEGRAGTERADV